MSALSERGFMFWALTPFLLLFLVLMPFLVEINSVGRAVGLIILELVVGLFWLALLNPVRFWWAGRAVGGSVFCVYLIYLVVMVCAETRMIEISGRRAGGMSSISALMGLIVFGLPGLYYALFARFTLRDDTGVHSDIDDDDDSDVLAESDADD